MSQASERVADDTFVITRERLLDGTHLARLRAAATPDFPIRSDAELEASLDEALADYPAGEDVWVFGYGSLMWNPAFHFAEQVSAQLRGYHRRFCLWLTRGRGTPARPGLMLALDRGGMCRGIAFRIPAAQARSEMLLIWRREMLSGAYLARWVSVATETGPIRAVTFVVNQAHKRYSGKLTEAETADRILKASGELGSCLDYFERTVRILRTLQVNDAALERIEAEIVRREGGGA